MAERRPVPLAGHPLADAAVEAFLAGLAAVDPTVLVKRAVRQGLLDDWLVDRERPRRINVLALGKAAPRMLWGLVEPGVPFRGLGVAPRGVLHPNVDTFRWLAGEHPVPGVGSLAAGREVLQWTSDYPAGEPLLVLLSGGASACVEVPTNGIGEAELASRWRSLLASGRPIEEVNRERSAWSRLKGGRLGRLLLECTPSIRVWLLADTDPASAPETVGSGPFWLPEAPGRIPHHTLAHNGDLVAAAGLRLGTEGWSVYRHGERITGEAERDVGAFLTALHRLPRDGPVALVGGGEPRVALPPDAPRGGRSQHAALRAATWLRSNRSDALFAAFASDGMDGSTDAAGAWVTAEDGGAGAEAALARFDAHGHLKARGRLVHVGATGTNVNDLWVALRPAP